MASLVVAGPLTDSVHAETPDHSRTLHSLVHAELSQGQFEASQQRATTGSTPLSVTHCWSLTGVESTGDDIWIQRPVGKQRNAGLVYIYIGVFQEEMTTPLHLTYKHEHTHSLTTFFFSHSFLVSQTQRHKTRRSPPKLCTCY